MLGAEDRLHARKMRDQGWLATKAQTPVLHGFGPPLPPPGSAEANLMWGKCAARTDSSSAHAFEGLDGICIGAEPVDPVPVAQEDSATISVEMAFVMHSDQGAEHGHAGRFSNRGLATLYARLHIRTMCFIHFFSGFRGEGDLQSQIEQHWVQGIHHIFCISIDYCLQGSQGDLSSTKSLAFWKTQVCNGAILGMGKGTPCETYSAARFLEGGPSPPAVSFRLLWIAVQLRQTVGSGCSGNRVDALFARDDVLLFFGWGLRIFGTSGFSSLGDETLPCKHMDPSCSPPAAAP